MQISTTCLSKPTSYKDDEKHGLKQISKRIAYRGRSTGTGASVSCSSTDSSTSSRSHSTTSSSLSTDISPCRPQQQHGDPIRRVACETKVRCRLVPSYKSYTDEEYNMSWYSVEEQKETAQGFLREVQKLEKGKLLHDVKYSARGLEGHTMTGALAKAKNRRLAYDVVLGEQDRQRRVGTQDANAIAEAYHAVAHSSELWARTVALRDQRDAMIFLENLEQDDQPCLREDNRQCSNRDISSSRAVSSKNEDMLLDFFYGDKHLELRERRGDSSNQSTSLDPGRQQMGTAHYCSQRFFSPKQPKIVTGTIV